MSPVSMATMGGTLPVHRLAISTTSIPFQCHSSFRCNYLSRSAWLLTSNYCYHQLAPYSQDKTHLTQHFRPENPGHVPASTGSIDLWHCAPAAQGSMHCDNPNSPTFTSILCSLPTSHPLPKAAQLPVPASTFCIFCAKNLLESQECVSKLKELNYFPIK